MKKQLFLTLSIALMFFAQSKTGRAQCPTLTTTATDVCTVYTGICGCQTSEITVNGTLPQGWSVVNTRFTEFGINFPAGQTSAPASDPQTSEAFFGTFPYYSFRDDPIFGGNVYQIILTFSTPTGQVTCSYPVNVGWDNTAAIPDFVTHAKTASDVASGQSFVTSAFYANDPITFDGRTSTGTYEYTLSCTPVNSSGSPIGATEYNSTIYYSPDFPVVGFAFHDLRNMFSNLVNPSGMIAIVYYRIDMTGIGCDGNWITESNIISIHHTVRAVKGFITGGGPSMASITVGPNPGSGVFSITSERMEPSVSIVIHSISGREVYHYEGTEFMRKTIDLTNEPKGIYLVQFVTKDGTTVERIEIM